MDEWATVHFYPVLRNLSNYPIVLLFCLKLCKRVVQRQFGVENGLKQFENGPNLTKTCHWLRFRALSFPKQTANWPKKSRIKSE